MRHPVVCYLMRYLVNKGMGCAYSRGFGDPLLTTTAAFSSMSGLTLRNTLVNNTTAACSRMCAFIFKRPRLAAENVDSRAGWTAICIHPQFISLPWLCTWDRSLKIFVFTFLRCKKYLAQRIVEKITRANMYMQYLEQWPMVKVLGVTVTGIC